MLIVPIPNVDVPSLGKCANVLFKISQLVDSNPDEDITLEFRNANFLSIVFLTGLHSLLLRWRVAGRVTHLAYPAHPSPLRSYLEAVCFEQGLQLPGAPGELDRFAALAQNPNKHYLPITHFPCYGLTAQGTSMFDTVWNHLVEAVQKVLQNPPPQYWQIFPYIFHEIGENVREHARADYGIFALQYYPHHAVIQVVIADNGRGMLHSYDGNPHFHPGNELEAFEFAMEGKSSKDRPLNESRGFGMSTSRNLLVNGTLGTYFLWSGQTFYFEHKDKKGIAQITSSYPAAHYDGCFVALQIPLRQNLLVDFDEATRA